MKPKQKTTTKVVLTRTEVERRWKRARGLLHGRLPKNPLAWQRNMRRDRKLVT